MSIKTHRSVWRIIVASPGDVQFERDAVDEIARELNRSVAASRGVVLEVHRWETDAYPGFHPHGLQAHLDHILKIPSCEILIGIFWKRIGTPLPDGQTGSEHELQLGFDAWKVGGRPRVMVYFNQAPYRPMGDDFTQGKKVEDLQKRLSHQLCWKYATSADFKDIFRQHLTKVGSEQESDRRQTEPTICYLTRPVDWTRERARLDEASGLAWLPRLSDRD